MKNPYKSEARSIRSLYYKMREDIIHMKIKVEKIYKVINIKII